MELLLYGQLTTLLNLPGIACDQDTRVYVFFSSKAFTTTVGVDKKTALQAYRNLEAENLIARAADPAHKNGAQRIYVHYLDLSGPEPVVKPVTRFGAFYNDSRQKPRFIILPRALLAKPFNQILTPRAMLLYALVLDKISLYDHTMDISQQDESGLWCPMLGAYACSCLHCGSRTLERTYQLLAAHKLIRMEPGKVYLYPAWKGDPVFDFGMIPSKPRQNSPASGQNSPTSRQISPAFRQNSPTF